MLASFNPITNKVYHALMKIDVTIDTIDEAKDRYTNGILSIKEACSQNSMESTIHQTSFEAYNLAYEEFFIHFMKKVYEMNSDKSVLVETKINELDNVSLLRIITILDYRDKLLFLDIIKNSSKSAFVARDVRIVELLTRLATRELLFSTFHFLSEDITICCQPKLAFPVFVTDFNHLETYIDIAQDSNLNICNLQVKY